MIRNLGALCLALCLLTVGGGVVANAQIDSVPQIEANVPFPFVVGDTMLPAGKYLIRTVDNDVLEIRSARNPTSVTFDTVGGPVEADEIQRKTKLVFDKIEGQYFLSQIWVGGSATGHELIESRMEKKLTAGGSLLERQAVVAVIKRTKP